MARHEAGRDAQARMLERLHRWIETLHSFPKPVIAAVEGAAAGAGFSIALACDLVVAAEDARFMLSHAKLGLSPDGGATWQLARARRCSPRQPTRRWASSSPPSATTSSSTCSTPTRPKACAPSSRSACRVSSEAAASGVVAGRGAVEPA
jgi:hypothetical protein